MALTTGYRALIQNLRGELQSARQMFDLAITMLEALDEQRSVALLRRHLAPLVYILEDEDAMVRVAQLAIANAESTQQMDIVYSARIVRHSALARSPNADDRLRATQFLNRAVIFAAQTDMHRVAIEARRSLAILKLANGDLESALEHARIAMALAGRYGFALFKISLRIVLGRILWARDNPEVGHNLIRNAIVLADRLGYQRAVDSAQHAIQNMLRMQ